MRSRASFKGHPIHPMLIPFPVAFLTGGLVADLLAALLDSEDLVLVAYYVIPAGIAVGLVAAVPGAIDYFGTVPPRSSGKKRATRHALVNVSALLFFSLAWYLRGGPGVEPEPVLIGLEAIGAGLLSIGGWMGGTLAYRNQVGVDHRYARAGKWKEARIEASGEEWIAVAAEAELELDQMKLLHLGSERIVLANTAEGWMAFDDRCTHRGGSLAGGVIACGTVTCPWHGSQFRVDSGTVAAGPAAEPLRTHSVRVEAGQVRISLNR